MDAVTRNLLWIVADSKTYDTEFYNVGIEQWITERKKNTMKLKECPFCGGKAEITFSGSYTNGGYIVAQCSRCGARSKGTYYRGPIIEIPLEETVGGEKTAERWNDRATDPPSAFNYGDDIVGKLKKVINYALRYEADPRNLQVIARARAALDHYDLIEDKKKQ